MSFTTITEIPTVKLVELRDAQSRIHDGCWGVQDICRQEIFYRNYVGIHGAEIAAKEYPQWTAARVQIGFKCPE